MRDALANLPAAKPAYLALFLIAGETLDKQASVIFVNLHSISSSGDLLEAIDGLPRCFSPERERHWSTIHAMLGAFVEKMASDGLANFSFLHYLRHAQLDFPTFQCGGLVAFIETPASDKSRALHQAIHCARTYFQAEPFVLPDNHTDALWRDGLWDIDNLTKSAGPRFLAHVEAQELSRAISDSRPKDSSRRL